MKYARLALCSLLLRAPNNEGTSGDVTVVVVQPEPIEAPAEQPGEPRVDTPETTELITDLCEQRNETLRVEMNANLREMEARLSSQLNSLESSLMTLRATEPIPEAEPVVVEIPIESSSTSPADEPVADAEPQKTKRHMFF